MCVVLNSRITTRDIDAIFIPKEKIRNLARQIAIEYNISENWLNDGVKGFLSQINGVELFNKLSNLTIYTATPEYMLAMKCISCRTTESSDTDDIKVLLHVLNIRTIEEVEYIIQKYYRLNRVPIRTWYILEGLLMS